MLLKRYIIFQSALKVAKGKQSAGTERDLINSIVRLLLTFLKIVVS